nr:T9SS type B sorting domain-containing protein [uncultured Flavobacterium sp.]
MPFPAPNLYRYSFDGGKTYDIPNEAWVDPRATPYTLYVKDAAGCIFAIDGIILDPKPAEPDFKVTTPVYNCKGEGTSTVTVITDPGITYTYKYYLGKPDPANPTNYIYAANTNVPANIFKDLPVGDYKLKVEYNLVSAPTFSNLLTEDFGNGDDTTSPGINNVYCFERQDAIVDCNKFNAWHPWLMNDGEYTVTKGLLPDHGPDFGWVIPKDHTNAPNITDGRYLAINIGGVNEGIPVGTVIYSKPIHDVIPDQDVKVTFYALNLLKSSNAKAAPDLTIELSKNGTAVPGASVKTAKITQNEQWNKIELTINPGNNKDLDFVIKTNIAIVDGSDLAIDDILVYQLPKSCLSAKTLNLKIDAGQSFSAEVTGVNGLKCKGDTNGTFSIVVKNFDTDNGFYYTLDGNANPVTWVKSMTSPVNFNDKAEGTYNIKVRYANNATSCNFDIPTTIKSPPAFIVNASASAATCKGATVTASVVGGTADYVVTLKDKNSTYTKTFPTTDWKINEVPAGTYIVSGTDAAGCSDTMDTELVISAPTKPTASIVSNVGLCFDGSNATIRVSISNGVKPYTYQVSTDGGTTYSNPSATFDGPTFDYIAKATGKYQFLILDANKCDAITASQTINDKITADADITKTLSCLTGSKDATIQVKITGGTSPYKYTVRKKGSTTVLFTSGSIAGPLFTYDATTAGTYVFDITDTNNCPFAVEKEVLSLVAVTASHKVENVTCYDAANGYIDITPETGVAPFSYQFNSTGNFTTTTHYGNLVGSVAGTDYSYIVKDGQGCTQSYAFKVYQPEDIVANASISKPYNCDGNGQITATASKGNGGFSFELRNKTNNTSVGTNTTGIFDNITIAGDYEVVITDNKNCSKTVAAGTITALNPPKGMTINNSAVTCPTNKATVTISNVVNGAGVAVPTTGLEYRIKFPAAYATTTYQTSNTFAGIPAGIEFVFEVRDANKCLYEKRYTITELPVIAVTVKSQNPVVCLGEANGKAIFTVSGMGNDVNYSYVVDTRTAVTGKSPATGTSFEIPVSGLSGGLHTITVTNTATTCSDAEDVTIEAPTAELKFNAHDLTHVTCDTKGTATINVVGGSGIYSYTIKQTAPIVGSDITQPSSNVFKNLDAGDYSIFVEDSYGCKISSTFTINDKVAPTASIDATATDLCAGGAGATITVNPSSAPNYVYSINKGTTTTNGVFTGLAPDDYIITVKDLSTGCSIDLPKQIVAVPVVVSEHKITKKLDCSLSTDAVIQATIANGYPDYKYRVNVNGAGFPATYTDVGPGQTTFTHPASVAGSYVFEILDSKGCKTGFTENVAAKVTPDFTPSITHVKCFGAATGKIVVTATPASGTYEYSNDNGSTWQASNEFAGLEVGSYDIVVRDTNTKCFVSKPITVNGPSLFEADAKVTTELKCGTNNASQAAIITVTALGGTPYSGTNKYRYTYNTGNPATTITLTTSNTFTINASGVVNIIVTDANGCTVSTSAEVVALTPPSGLAFSAPDITCDATKLKTDLEVTVTGGKLPLKYEITSYVAATAPAVLVTTENSNTYTFTGLVSGTYNFTITDANGCTVKDTKKIDAVVPIEESGKIDNPVSCKDANDGRLIFTVSGNTNGTTGYTYSLVDALNNTITGSKSGDVITYSGLKADSYTFSVTNNLTKCEANETIVLANPTGVTIVSAAGPKVFCDRNNSTITVTANGGTGTLYYAVVKAASTAPTFPADYTTTKTFPKNTLTDGLDYDVYVRDAKGCPAQTTAQITRDPKPTVDPITTAPCYSGSNISIVMSGNVFIGSGILYGVDGNYSSIATKTITSPGIYKLTVKDDNGCISDPFDLVITDQLKLTVTPIKDLTCTVVPPFTKIDAKATLSAQGGNSTYTYEFKNGTGGTYAPIVPAGNVFETTATGSYYFRVTSAGCSVESTVAFEVTTPDKPVATTDVTNLNCYQSKDGSVTLVPTAGVGPFTFTFNGGTPTSNPTFTNLDASTGLGYPYTITDAKGCTSDIAYAVVTEPAEIQFTYTPVDMRCPGPTLGSVTVSAVTNGVGPYTYELRNIVTGTKIVDNQDGITPYTFDKLNYGDFILTVYDSNGCPSVKKDVKIVAPPSDLNIDLTTVATCAAGATIIVDLNPLVYPANPDYRFGISDTPDIPFASVLLPSDPGFPLRHTFTGLTPGVKYTFVIYDPITDCYYFKTATGAVDPITSLTSVATAIPVACKNTSTGGVSITLNGTSATQVKYEIYFDNSDKSSGISGTITMPTTVPVEVTGLIPGTYYVKFTEIDGSNPGCTSASLPFVVTESSVDLSVTAKSPKNDNCKNDAGQVVATPKGGTGPFKYIINQSATPPLVTAAWGADNDNIFNVEAGSYYVWVKDAYNCIKSTTVTVNADPVPVIDKLDIVNKCAAEGNFEVTVSMTTQGVAPYYISLDGGSNFTKITDPTPFPYTIKGLNSGPVNVVIKDFNDCQDNDNITITPTPLAKAEVTKVLNCNALNAVTDATITITIEKGTTNYSYEVKKGTAGTYAAFTPTTTNVTAGITTITYTVAEADADVYQFRIKDANTCSIETLQVAVDAIVPTVLATPIKIEPSCFGPAELGSVEIGVTSGTGPFKYSFDGLAFSDQTLYPVVAGTYNYIVRNALGCETSSSVTLGTPTALAFDPPTIVPLSCGPLNAAQSATVTLIAKPGSGSSPYKFSFDGSSFENKDTYTVKEGDAGRNIPYEIQDVNGCTVASTVNIAKLTPPTDFKFDAYSPITCSNPTTSVTISGVIGGAGGAAALKYQIISPSIVNNFNNATFAGLLPDVEYVFQVTDANNCTFERNLKIDNVVKIDIIEQSTTGITCSTATDGKATFYVSNYDTGVKLYHYKVDGIAVAGNHSNPVINLIGLTKDAHEIEVFDNETNCSKKIGFNIAAPPAALVLGTPVVTTLGCTTFGSVKVTATGGWGDYTFTLTLPDNSTLTNTDGVFENLIQPGFYDLEVKDANNCTDKVTDSFELLVAPKPTLTIATTSDYCYYNTNSTKLVITAASTSTFPVTYMYSIDNGGKWETNNEFTNLSPNTYVVKVRDNYGCESAATTTVIKPQLFASAKVEDEIFCNNVDGKIRIKAIGGYPDYSYTVAINGATPSAKIPFGSGFTFADYTVNAASYGKYEFVVYDSQNCEYKIPAITMTAPQPVVFTAVPTSAYCAPSQGNVSNGSILFTLTSKDNPDYNYSIQRTIPTVGAVFTQNTPLFTDLVAGTYEVNVTSGRNCGNPTTVTILDPALVEAEAEASPFTCSGTNTLNTTVVTVTGKGGTGTYTYSENGTDWRPGNTFNVIDNQSVQTLTYYVKDANGCIDSDQITVDPFPKLDKPTITRVTQIACNNTGEVITVQINGGATPYNFHYQVSVDGAAFGLPVIPVTAGTNSFNYEAKVAGHYYQFKITDNTTGCFILSESYFVPLYNTAKVVATASTSVSCNGLSDGKITINIIDYTGPYTYRVLNNNVAVAGVSGSGDSSVTNPFEIPFGLNASKKYTVEITETAYPFCTVTSGDVEITQPPVLDLSGLKVAVKNQNCNNTGAVLTIDETQIVGGSGGYTYAFVPVGSSPTVYDPSKTKTIATTKIAPLFDQIDVYVKDKNGCPQHVTVNISLDPLPSITNVSVASQCASTTGYRINVAANGVAPLKYSLDGVQFQDDNFFIVNTPGNYTVTVQDKNQCTTTAATAFHILDPLTLSAKITKVPTCKAADGTITLEAKGGTVSPPSYLYTKDNWATSTVDPVFTGLAPRAYTFKVRDIATLCEQEVQETIFDPTPVTGIVATPTDVSCNGVSNGRISVTIAASNDNPVYMYSLAGPVSRVAQESPFFNDLPFGNYVVTVTSGRGCSDTAQATVGQPPVMVVNKPTVTQYICSSGTNNAGNATIIVAPGSVSGGSNNYIRYQFVRDGVQVQNDDRNSYTESDYLGGDYIVNVFDSKGCQGTYATVTIDPYLGISDLKIVATQITCNSDEAIQVTAIAASGTLPTLTYTIVGIDGNTYPLTPSVDGLWTNLKVGNYKIVVTNPVTGCSIERYHTVNEPNTFKFVSSNIKNITCFSDSDGAITLTLVDNIVPDDNAGRFSYVITHESGTVMNGVTTTTELKLSNLKSGKYTVVATLIDTPFCDVKTEFSIEGPAAELEIKPSKKDITCVSGNDDGEIRISAQGGWSGDYLYKLDGPVTVDFSAQNIFSGLKAGLYTVSVKDAGGCIDTDQIRLDIPTPIAVTAVPDKTLLLCNGDMSATITATSVTGGQGSNYLYTLNTTSVTPVRSTGPQTTPSFAGLGAGTYTITVTDGYNCRAESAPITITEPSEVKPSLAQTRNNTCLTKAQLTLSASGGTPPYTYSSDNVTYSTAPFTSSVSFDVEPGVYKYYVKDANGCVDFDSNTITVNPIEQLLANIDRTHAVVLCREDPSGVIIVNASGGLGNYQYILQDSAGNILKGPQSKGRFDKLLAGDYKIVVKSGDCETPAEDVNIDQPDEVFSAEFNPTPVKCFGGNDGRIEVIAKGGTGNYKYSISPRNDQYFDSNIFEKLKAGFYTVIATDEHGCYDTDIVEVKQPLAPLSVVETPGMTMPEECAGELNGAFTIDIAGGTLPYMVSLNNINGPYQLVNGTQHTFDNLAGAVYTVFVKDGGNCPQEVEVSVPLPVVLNPTAKVNYDCVNNTQANMVVVTIDPSNNPVDVDYSLDNNGTFQESNIFTNVAPGQHIIVARHTNGCIKETEPFTVDAVNALSLIDVTKQSKEINTIEVKASGGVAPYEYSFNGEPFSSSNTYRIYKSGIYKVIVRDKNGCEATIDVEGTFYDFCMPNYFTPIGTGSNTTIGPDCGALAYKDLTFDVYDRYGRVVGKYRVGGKWDGRYHGNELPTGDYWYVLKLNDPKDPREFVGHFTLYR